MAKLTYNTADRHFLRKLSTRIAGSRVLLLVGAILICTGGWILFRQHRMDLSESSLQLIRLGIVGFGLMSLVSAIVLSRWSLLRDRIEHESRLRSVQDQERANVRFQTALEFSVVPKLLVDHDGYIVYANPAFARLTSRTPVELIGHQVSDLTRSLDADPLHASLEADFPASVVVDYCEIANPLDMVQRTLRRVVVPIPNSGDETYAAIVQFDDVTQTIENQRILADDKKVLEERVEQRTRALAMVNSELESFAYSVSHDLRGPLRAIDGFGKVLRHSAESKLAPNELDYLDRIIAATTRMGDLIDALLRMSRLATAQLNVEDLDLSQLLDDVVLDVRMQYPGHQVAVDIQPGMRVRGDRTLLHNAFANIIGNSFKFTRDVESPRLEVRMVPRNEFWNVVEVSDNGAGFEQKYADKLFKPFQRLHRSDEYEGHGIGLASIKKVVDRHGGKIEARGEKGQGATISMTLPAASKD